MSEFEITSCIICDDIRLEANGKHIIVGVYPGDIVVGRQPPGPISSVAFAVWFELSIRDSGEHHFGLKIDLGEKEVFSLNDMKFDIDARYNVILPIGPISIPLEHSDLIKIYIRMDNRKWRHARTKNVHLMDAQGTIVTQQSPIEIYR